MRRAALAMAAAAATLVGGLLSAGPVAARHASGGLYDARYCEIFELRGTIPNAEVVVFNTIGLDDCPAAKWRAIDPAALARRLGVAAVILNGPRHFLMDSAAGRIGAPRAIAGIRMRRVASIPITSADQLVQTPYTRRTIERHNSWRWRKGRRVYELIAPGGARYVMQSYSQIRDPHLSLVDLRSLGRRLDLPPGWRYRSHRLGRDLVLRARGEATVIQDDLLDTYQRVPGRHRR